MASISALHSIPVGVPANGNMPVGSVLPASATEVTELLEDVDPMIIGRVLATNASIEEIREALRLVQDDELAADGYHTPTSARVGEVKAILEDGAVFDGDMFDDEFAFDDGLDDELGY